MLLYDLIVHTTPQMVKLLAEFNPNMAVYRPLSGAVPPAPTRNFTFDLNMFNVRFDSDAWHGEGGTHTHSLLV